VWLCGCVVVWQLQKEWMNDWMIEWMNERMSLFIFSIKSVNHNISTLPSQQANNNNDISRTLAGFSWNTKLQQLSVQDVKTRKRLTLLLMWTNFMCINMAGRGLQLHLRFASRHISCVVGSMAAGRERDGIIRDWAVDSTHEADSRRVPLQMWADILAPQPGVYNTLHYLRLCRQD